MNIDGLEIRVAKNNTKWLLPTNDTNQWNFINKTDHWNFPFEISKLCKNKNLVIQAGGNAGVYPKHYSKIFNQVITFEPDYKNFICLSVNAFESNIIKIQACLGETKKNVNLEFPPDQGSLHQGGIRVNNTTGTIPVISIDESFDLTPDLIHLDVEGFEAFAIKGMKNTILKSKPIIVLETNNSGENYGYPQSAIDDMMDSLGYHEIKKWKYDTAYEFKI